MSNPTSAIPANPQSSITHPCFACLYQLPVLESAPPKLVNVDEPRQGVPATAERESLRSSAAPAALAGVGSPRELKRFSARAEAEAPREVENDLLVDIA